RHETQANARALSTGADTRIALSASTSCSAPVEKIVENAHIVIGCGRVSAEPHERLDEAKVETLRAWGEGLALDARDEVRAAGRHRRCRECTAEMAPRAGDPPAHDHGRRPEGAEPRVEKRRQVGPERAERSNGSRVRDVGKSGESVGVGAAARTNSPR